MKKKVVQDANGRQIKQVGKRKPQTPYVEPPFIAKYRRDRDMSMLYSMFVSEETKTQIREKYGI